jgi:hypothetical protein
METEGSLSSSQYPSNGPYPEPDRSSPCHTIHFRSLLVLSTHLRPGLPSGLFPSGFPTAVTPHPINAFVCLESGWVDQ